MTTQKRIERKAVSLFDGVYRFAYGKSTKDIFKSQVPSVQSGWLSLAKKVVRLENRVRIMRVKEFKK